MIEPQLIKAKYSTGGEEEYFLIASDSKCFEGHTHTLISNLIELEDHYRYDIDFNVNRFDFQITVPQDNNV